MRCRTMSRDTGEVTQRIGVFIRSIPSTKKNWSLKKKKLSFSTDASAPRNGGNAHGVNTQRFFSGRLKYRSMLFSLFLIRLKKCLSFTLGTRIPMEFTKSTLLVFANSFVR